MTVLDQPLLDQPLSTAMREGSQLEHQAAEGSTFMTELLAGRVDAAGYASYLLRLRQVYDALESTARAHLDDPAVAAVHDPVLDRIGALDADLAHWAPTSTPPTRRRSTPPSRRRTASGCWTPATGAGCSWPTTTPATSATSPAERPSAGSSTGSSA